MTGLFDGRGRWYRWHTKSTVDDYLRLDAQAVGRHGLDQWRSMTWRWSWSNVLAGQRTATITILVTPPLAVVLHYRHRGEQHEQQVRIRRTPTHNGGHRLDWLCPRCGRAVRHLYGAPFACRTCHNLAYPSQQAAHHEAGRFTVKRRLSVLRKRLGLAFDAEQLPASKPSGMRWRTWLRLSEEWRELRHVEAEYMLRIIYGGNGPAMWAQLGMNRAEVMPYLTPAEDMAGYRMRKRAGVYEPDPWLVQFLRKRKQKRAPSLPLTIHQLAKAADVGLAFAQEAQREGLLRPDYELGTRWPRYRPGLARWLAKLHRLRAEGLTWSEISAWTARRWRPGQEHERAAPASKTTL